MANKHEGEVAFSALGRDLTLRLTSRAVASIETQFGQGFGALLPEIEAGSVRIMAALLRHGAGVDEETAYQIIDDVGLQALADPLGRAIEESGAFKGSVEAADEGKPEATA